MEREKGYYRIKFEDKWQFARWIGDWWDIDEECLRYYKDKDLQEIDMDYKEREEQAEYLKEKLAMLLNDDKNNPVTICHIEKALFIEMAFCFIAKHGK